MGHLRIPAAQKASWEALDSEFQKIVTGFTKSLPVDTMLYSGYRGVEKQAFLRAAYDAKAKVVNNKFKAGQLTQAQYDAEMKKLRGQIANRPFYSAHNWGVAVDIHPVTYSSKDYQIMKDMAPSFGLLRDSVEKWHFQDARFKRDMVPQWLKNAPDWLTSKTKEAVQKAAKALLAPGGVAAAAIVVVSLGILCFF